ncbi:MAG: hypothetical protein JXA82_04390 [Sedimentisphaerales bacterium]|nr:hypothetical protein [Sedimentisphaerales bacterium]
MERKFYVTNILGLILVLTIPLPLFAGTILYVDDDAAPEGDGLSWNTSLKYLQDALMLASKGDEIRVAQGVYKPDEFVLSDRPGRGREETFPLKNGVALRGGYAGLGTSDPDVRDVKAYQTILSGDLDENDLELVNPYAEEIKASRLDNSYSVITIADTNSVVVINGFTITAGYSDSRDFDDRHNGGGLNNSVGGTVTIMDCTFMGNESLYGGGIYSQEGDLEIIGCTFIKNIANGGGAVLHNQDNAFCDRCRFYLNWGWDVGGGVYVNAGDLDLLNCIFTGNFAEDWGGGAVWYRSGTLELVNCTLAGNKASDGGDGIYNKGNSLTIVNSIIRDVIDTYGGTPPLVFFSNISDDWWGGIQGTGTDMHNIDVDPMFIRNPNDGGDGWWRGDNDDLGDLHLLRGSPCIDAGNNTYVLTDLDLDGNPRITNRTVDIGAYEFHCKSTIIYVDDSATGMGDGSCWSDAFTDLQNALAEVVQGQEIRVAQGIYRPADPNGSRESVFVLKDGVAIRGGYAGFGATNPDARDIGAFESILSGDLAGDDYIFSGDDDDHGPWHDFSREDNSENVVLASGLQSGAVLEGFTISGGQGGGGLVCEYAVDLEVRDCLFRENLASAGGGLHSSDSTNCRVIHCVFTDNYATGNGGAVSLSGGSLTLDHCLIVGNQAEHGGGIYLENAAATIVNCTVAQNVAHDQWGGVAVEVEGDVMEDPGTSRFLSCIFWGNTCESDNIEWAQIGRNFGIAAFDFCCVQGWTGKFAGIGTIDQNPLFVSPGHWDTKGTYYYYDDVWIPGDYYLRSQAGRWDPQTKAWVQDTVTSPCIDAGDPASPIMYEPFPNGGIVNMGAYGGTAEASRSWFDGPVCETIVIGDINGDCRVNLTDLALMATHWLEDQSDLSW